MSSRAGWVLRGAVLPAFLVGTGGLCGCGSAGSIRVETEWTPGTVFTEVGSTFAWPPLAAAKDGARPAAVAELDAGMRRTIEQAFVDRGYRLGTPADFVIRYYLTATKQGDPTEFGGIREYEEGSLILDVLKPDGRRLWRGWARTRIHEAASPTERQARTRAAVEAPLKDFPEAKK